MKALSLENLPAGQDSTAAWLELLPVAALVLDDGLKVSLVNRLARRYFRTLSDQSGELEVPQISELVLQMASEGLSWFRVMQEQTYEFEARLGAGTEIRAATVCLSHLKLIDGESAILAVFMDITPQKRLAAMLADLQVAVETEVSERTVELEAANRLLRDYLGQLRSTQATLNKFAAAVDSTADHVIITDARGAIEFVNRAFENFSGYRLEEIHGQTPRVLKSGRHPPEFYEKFWATISAGKTFKGVFINRKKSGADYGEEKTISPIFDDRGRISHYVSTGREVKPG